jgi:hypothetical protein
MSAGKGRVIELRAVEFPSAHEAIQHAYADGRGNAIHLGGKNLVVSEADAERLAAAGVYFAYLFDYRGRILTVPVNG